MRKSTLISVRISEDLARRLEKLSEATERSKSFLAVQAIEDYLSLHEWQVEAIKDGIDAAERGDLRSHEEALAELSKWGRKHDAA